MQLKGRLRLCQSCLRCCRSGLLRLSTSSAHRMTVNYYELLGVKPNASIEEIKNAFFDKSKKMHPDSDPSNPDLHSQFVELNEAYRVLSKDLSRKEYDLRLRQPYSSASSYSYSPRAGPQESMRYWEQFRRAQPRETSAETQENTRRRNRKLMGYCILTMVVSIGLHFLFFRKLAEVHSSYMDEKDRALQKMYDEAKERARVNGFKKQTEILRQKHAELQQRLRGHDGGEDK